MLIGTAILVLGVMGLVFAGLLGFAADYFHVEEDPRIGQLLSVLPGANCGACGLAGCRDYSERLVHGEVPPNACTAGGAKVCEEIAAVLGIEAGTVDCKVAVIHCGARIEQRKSKGHYTGIETCFAVHMVNGGGHACAYGCLGYGDCGTACPFGAILMVEGLAVVDPSRCTGCGNCVNACPRKIITLQPRAFPVVVACASRDTGAVTRKICPVGCIACKICVKQAPGLFAVADNLASVDLTRGDVACEGAIEKCPTKCLVKTAG